MLFEVLVSPTQCDGCGAIVKTEPCQLCGHRNLEAKPTSGTSCPDCGHLWSVHGRYGCDMCACTVKDG